MHEHECPDLPSFRVSLPGPFTHHDVVVDGWRVPLMHAQVHDDLMTLVLDERFGLELTIDEAERVIPFVANCIAVALGFTEHPSSDDDAPMRSPHPKPERVHMIAGLGPPT
jgi:hypothetical protein